jgi:hypothetical protein
VAERCTFCYEEVTDEHRGAVDFTIPVCRECKPNFPLERILIWEIAQQEFELPLEELKANCVWAPIEENRIFDPSTESGFSSDKTYVFDERDVLRYIKRRYGDRVTFRPMTGDEDDGEERKGEDDDEEGEEEEGEEEEGEEEEGEEEAQQPQLEG